MNAKPYVVNVNDAGRISDWLTNRGGILIWRSINLSNPSASWTTPALTEDGKPYGKPTWQAADEPERHITDPADVIVSIDKVVKRFHIGVRMGANGLQLKVTDAGSRRIRREVEKAGEGAYHEFDYSSQDAVILAPEKQQPLTEWLAERGPNEPKQDNRILA